MSLEEHWLEGTELPFIVFTDHKNLEYLRTAKCLNFKQVRLALMFTQYNFSLSYRAGFQKVKPDALSRAW